MEQFYCRRCRASPPPSVKDRGKSQARGTCRFRRSRCARRFRLPDLFTGVFRKRTANDLRINQKQHRLADGELTDLERKSGLSGFTIVFCAAIPKNNGKSSSTPNSESFPTESSFDKRLLASFHINRNREVYFSKRLCAVINRFYFYFYCLIFQS